MNKFSVICEGVTVNMNISRKEARQVVASLKAQGKKARVVDQNASPASRAFDTAITEGKPALGIAAAVQQGATYEEAASVIVEESLPDGKVINHEVAEPVNYGKPIDLATLGMSLALADLADALGLSIEGVIESTAHLLAAGLPSDIPSPVARRAHQIYRNMVDGMLYRAGCFPKDPPQLSKPEADVLIMQNEEPSPIVAKQLKARADDEQAVKAFNKPASVRTFTTKGSIFGFSATAVIRWLGKRGIDLQRVLAILSANGVTGLSDSTVKIQLKAGATGQRGEPAPLTEEQGTKLLAS